MASWAPAPGERIGEDRRFEVIEQLGIGGMGHVFRAIDWHLDRTVAIKFILQNHEIPAEQLVALLKREAKVTAKLNHENVVAIFDMDAHHGVPFLVMELLDGQSLDAMVKQSRLTPLRATRIMGHVARGLTHAHANGIVHRDLKPSNVFILRDGRAKILDFGISGFERPIAARAPSDLGPTILGVGTPPFMAPEQWRGEPQDGRVDIWAAGVMFYFLLTGQLPYSVPELLKFRSQARVRASAPSVRQLTPTLPPEADRLVATALTEDREGRFQTARELADALSELERIFTGVASDADAVSAAALRVERRPVTLLACRLDGLAGRDLDDVIEADDRFYQVCADAVQRWEGCIGTPVGGKFFGCFGYPAAKETDAEHAVRAALQIMNTLRALPPSGAHPFDFRIGIHGGIVGLPNLPGHASAIPAMQGDVPNVAVRLTDRAAPNTVVMSSATLSVTKGLFLTEALADNIGGPSADAPTLPAYRVTSEIEAVSRFDQGFAAHQTPFVGREMELGLIYQLWEEAKDGRGQVLLIRGDPGIGKSRMVQVLRDRVVEEQNIRLTCQCRPHFKNTALNPVIQLISHSMRIGRDDGAVERLTKLEDGLSALGFNLPETVPLFASLLSIPTETRYAPVALTPEVQKGRTLDALVSMLLRISLDRPAVFIIEDMHWVDHSTIEYLNALIDLVPAARLLIVLTARPEFRAPWSARRHLHQVTLDRLSAVFTTSMIEQVAKQHPLPSEMVEKLVATTDGVPLFVEELTRMVVENWGSDDDPRRSARMPIPGTLHELLLARLDRLRGLGKQVAELGSVLGRDFSYALVRQVASLDELSLQDGLEILVEDGLLQRVGEPPASKYIFKHALIQEAAYQSLVKGDRQQHHRRAVEALIELSPDSVNLEPELLAYHYAEAGLSAEAIVYWEKAGQRAAQRSALIEAIDHYSKALDALKMQPAGAARDVRELSLLLSLGSPLMSVHGYANAEVEKNYARARDLAVSAGGGQVDLFPAMQGLWQFYYVRGMLPTSRSLGEKLLEIAAEGQSSTFRLLAHRSFASSVFLMGDFESCRVHTRAGLDIYDVREHGSLALRTGHDPGVAHGVYQAWALWMLGFPDQCLTTVLEMVALAKRLAHPMTEAYALCFAALMRNHRGEHAEARLLADEALAITTENKFALWTAWGTMQRGWALAGGGDYGRGIPQMRDGLDLWKQTGARVGFTFFPVTLAEMCLKANLPADAMALLDEAAPMVETNDERFYEAELLRLKGELAIRTGDRAAVADAAADV
ncbi:MAG: protein kinase, partial [Acidobacteriota bacterium]